MSNKNNQEYIRKEWMHPEDLDMEKSSNHVLYLKHLVPYEKVSPSTKGLNVLEIGCGSGYGNRFLSEEARYIYTVDIDDESLKFAKKHNPSSKVEYIHADVTKGVPLPDNSCDICVCFQVIEHIAKEKMDSFINEIKRIVTPGGKIYFTTPNRKIRLYPFQQPTNKYHFTEYTGKGLEKLLSLYFSDVNVFGLQAIDQLKQIEINRSKKSLFDFLIKRPIKSFLKLFGISGPILPVSKSPTQPKNTDRSAFSTENFWFDKGIPDDSIDLFAECINPNTTCQ